MKQNKSTLFKNVLRDKDERGEILSIVDHNVSNVSIIKCKANTIRSNHYHLTDWHLMYVLSGKIDYFFKEINLSPYFLNAFANYKNKLIKFFKLNLILFYTLNINNFMFIT